MSDARRARRGGDTKGRRTKRPGLMAEPGPMGWDPLTQARDRFAGTLPILNGEAGSKVLYWTSYAEFIAALVMALYPGIASIGRGDMSDSAAEKRNVTSPYGHRFPIAYTFEQVGRWYLPDFMARTDTGRMLIIEAGIGHVKGSPQNLAKLSAARDLALASNGELLVVAADQVPPRFVRNSIGLHLARRDYQGPLKLTDAIGDLWRSERLSMAKVIARFGPSYGASVALAAARKVAGDLLAAGRLATDLSDQVLTLATPISALPQDKASILPPGIIRDLETLRDLAATAEADSAVADGAVAEGDGDPAAIDVIDLDAIEDPLIRDLVMRREKAVGMVLHDGSSRRAAAIESGLEVRHFQMLYPRFLKLGYKALLPFGTSGHTGSTLPEKMQAKIRALHVQTERLSITAIVEHREITALAKSLKMERSPSRDQVSLVIAALARTDQEARQARAGRTLVPFTARGRAVTTERVPGLVCEFDEATVDVKVLAHAASKVTVRVHVGVLTCVATREPVAVVMSPKALDQWDVRRCLLRAALPREHLVKRYGLKTKQSPAILPMVVRVDRGRIETCRLVIQASADLPFILEFAPTGDAHAKPVIESFNRTGKERFEHRLPITTKSSPADRGVHDPDAAARRLGIDVERFEAAFMRWVFDVYRTKWHKNLRGAPADVAADGRTRFGVRAWQGTPEALRRLLKRDEGTRLVERHGIWNKDEWYGADFLDAHLRETVQIKVDEDDVRTIDVYSLKGTFLGTVRSDRIAKRFGRAVSRWELELEKVADKSIAAAANAEALGLQHGIEADLAEPVKARRISRQAHQQSRAAETSTEPTTGVPKPAPKPPVLSSLAAPEADTTVYVSLIDDDAA